MWLYEVLIRGKSDGTISGAHVRRATTTNIDGQDVDSIGPVVGVSGADVQAVLGEANTALAKTIEAKDVEIAALTARVSELEA